MSIEFDGEKFLKNKLVSLNEIKSSSLYGGYILACDIGHINAEVYRKGKYFVCLLHQVVPWSEVGWVCSGKCNSAEEAVTDAILKAGYSSDELHWYDGGWVWLRNIGLEFGDTRKIYNFGRM